MMPRRFPSFGGRYSRRQVDSIAAPLRSPVRSTHRLENCDNVPCNCTLTAAPAAVSCPVRLARVVDKKDQTQPYLRRAGVKAPPDGVQNDRTLARRLPELPGGHPGSNRCWGWRSSVLREAAQCLERLLHQPCRPRSSTAARRASWHRAAPGKPGLRQFIEQTQGSFICRIPTSARRRAGTHMIVAIADHDVRLTVIPALMRKFAGTSAVVLWK